MSGQLLTHIMRAVASNTIAKLIASVLNETPNVSIGTNPFLLVPG